MTNVIFEREEVQFTHDEEDFIYNFHCLENRNIAFRRLLPGLPIQEAEVDIYAAGEKRLVNIALIVLYKATASGQHISGFLPNILSTMLNLYSSKKALVASLTKAISSFPAKTPIASADQVMEFVQPYALWMVYSSNLGLVTEESQSYSVSCI